MVLMMCNFLKFIDSPDVREYNKNTYFTPAEWAVIIGLSMTRTVEEKIEALQYLVERYDENCFEEESANMEPRAYGCKNTMPSRQVVIETIQAWKKVLQNRHQRKDGIYAAKLVEKGVEDMISDYSFFHFYEEAYAFLSEKKLEYTKKNHDGTELYAQIKCLYMDDEDGLSFGDCYLFDGSLRLIEVWAGDSSITLLDEPEYPIYVPLPFKKGDIIKIESLRYKPFYGMMSCDWKAPAKDEKVHMQLPLELYHQRTAGDFDFTDDRKYDVLRASVCSGEEL